MKRSSVIALLATLTCVGCPAGSEETRPPDDQFFFPAGLEVTEDQRFLFVANSNGDLRYDSGTVTVVDLEQVSATVSQWLEDETPLPDTDDPAAGTSSLSSNIIR